MSFSLTHLNTLAVPSSARTLHRVTSVGKLLSLAPLARSENVLVLGGGSNVVLGAIIERPVLLMRNRGIELTEHGTTVEVTAAAGESWHDLVRWTLGNGLYGLENLALIPGSVGAAPVQNIGAYGVELSSRFVRLTALDREQGNLSTLNSAECEFDYRQSLFKSQPGRFVIATVTLALTRSKEQVEMDYADLKIELDRMGITIVNPVAIAEAVIRIRRRKLPDPRLVPNTGSFFKNPTVDRQVFEKLCGDHGQLRGYALDDQHVKLAAAQLIELCGFKQSLSAGPVRVWPRQALVLTNPGRATASEVLARAAEIQVAVAKRFDVRLEIEPDIIDR